MNMTEWFKDGVLKLWNHYDEFCCSIIKMERLEQLDNLSKSPHHRVGKVYITRRLYVAVGLVLIDVCFCAQDREKRTPRAAATNGTQ
jgi:hypothetical protein